jgi:hypothetical protein
MMISCRMISTTEHHEAVHSVRRVSRLALVRRFSRWIMAERERTANENHSDNCCRPCLSRCPYRRKLAMDDLEVENSETNRSKSSPSICDVRLNMTAEKTMPNARPDAKQQQRSQSTAISRDG